MKRKQLIWLPWAVVALYASYLVTALQPPKVQIAFNLNDFARLPVLNGGRIKPMDTVARTSLLMLSGKQTLRTGGKTRCASEWLTGLLFNPSEAASDRVFEIDDPDVLGLLGIQQTRQRRYAFLDLQPKAEEIERQSAQADSIKPEQRSRFQRAILTLHGRLTLYQKLQNTLQVAGSEQTVLALKEFESRLGPAMKAHAVSPRTAARLLEPLMRDMERYRFLDHVAEFYPLPLNNEPGRVRPWVTIGTAVLARAQSDAFHPGVLLYAAMSDAWRGQDPIAFNQALSEYHSWLASIVPKDVSRAYAEFLFNVFSPFYQSLIIYLLVFLLALGSWMLWPELLNRTAFYLLILAFAVHTGGLIARMVLQGRPPVTNLYSSAIFVGWVSVLLGIVLERLHKNAIGSMVAALIGFITLIVAHHLASTGDTLEMMRAVLDSNFWLATHVVCITIGYGSTFLSGFLATVYLFRRAFDKTWNTGLAQSLERMVYGIVCFSTLFSFVGTILGGIWADQSWGRFWGWDPKENGALMIVLWNVFILHARWGGYAEGKWLMVLAVVGNIVTALSWFGVNMLGIGLHSYGFMDKAFIWLLVFVLSQIAVISAGWLHPRKPDL